MELTLITADLPQGFGAGSAQLSRDVENGRLDDAVGGEVTRLAAVFFFDVMPCVLKLK